jgi:hypothetical protein
VGSYLRLSSTKLALLSAIPANRSAATALTELFGRRLSLERCAEALVAWRVPPSGLPSRRTVFALECLPRAAELQSFAPHTQVPPSGRGATEVPPRSAARSRIEVARHRCERVKRCP